MGLLLALAAPAWTVFSDPITIIFQEGVKGYQGTRDNSLYEDQRDNTNGGHPFLYAGNNKLGSPRRFLIAFDLSGVPRGARILAAELTFVVERSADNNAFAEPHTIHRSLADWGEGSVDTLQIDPESDGGGGSAAQAGDATWNSNFHLQSAWSNPGGDFVPTPSATTDFFGAGSSGTFSGVGLVADAQFWLERPGENFGWIVRGNEVDLKRAKRFHASEGELAFRPRLVLTFDPPSRIAASRWRLYR